MNAKEIAEKIFYSPATNGQAEKSIEDGVKMIESLLPKWQPIEELINLEYGVWVVVKERAREKWTYDIHQITQYTPREVMQRFYSHFLILPKL
jgi:phage pi2 protein 07